MTTNPPQKDGLYTRFNFNVMGEIVGLANNFANERDANTFYGQMRRRAKFKRLVTERTDMKPLAEQVIITGDYQHRCTAHLTHPLAVPDLELRLGRENPMEVLHIVAHHLQPANTRWHGGEFVAVFLDLVGMMFGPDVKREAKDIVLANKMKTSTRKVSEDVRARQTDRLFQAKDNQTRQGLIDVLERAKKLGSSDN